MKVALLLGALGAVALAEEAPTSMVDRTDAIFADYDSTRTPDCSLGVIQDGELVYARGYGMASLDHAVRSGSRPAQKLHHRHRHGSRT